MKITYRLALNQLVRNRKRTAGTCVAIALSTALITANMSFVTSGIAMLERSLGEDLGDYSGAYNAMIIIPAVLLTLLIVFMSVTVISNIFQASANDRIKELGILKCVGGTSRQVRKTVICEGLWLSIVGIPAGLAAGTLIGYLGTRVAAVYIDRIVEISRAIAMRKMDLSLSFVVSVYTYIAAAAVALVTVLASALKPARQMGGIAPIECVRSGAAVREDIRKAKTSSLWRSLLGFEGELGARNIDRNRKAFRPAIRALATGICLMLTTAGVTAQLMDIRKLMKSEDNRLCIDYVSLRDEGEDPVTGRRNNIILHPIDSATYDAINRELDAYGDFEVYGIGSNRDSFFAKADSFIFSDDMKKVKGIINEYGEMEIDIVSVTEGLYGRFCEATGTPYGGNILINSYRYNDFGHEKKIVPFSEDMKEITLVRPDGETSALTIDGYLTREDVGEWYFDYLNMSAVMVIVPGAQARYFDWYCEPGAEEEAFTEYAGKVMAAYFDIDSDDPYAEQGFTYRISREDDMAMALNIMIILGEIIMYGFVILLALIGFAGFISTITSNLRIRSREFAVLRSVGMTGPALRKMVLCESIVCTLKASLRGVAAGILIPFLINLPLRSAFPVRYSIPFAAGILSVGIVFLTVIIITGCEIRRMKGLSLIETIRAQV